MNKKLVLRWLILAALLFVVAGAARFALGYVRPPVPVEWRSITVGMPRDEVLRRLPDLFTDMRELKGYDLATREFKQWSFRDCWWQMFVIYDRHDRVKAVTATFTDPNCGLFNTGRALAN